MAPVVEGSGVDHGRRGQPPRLSEVPRDVTSYYDQAAIHARPPLAARFRGSELREVDGFRHRLHVHRYQTARFSPAFCGGSAAESRWLTRDDLLGALRHVGFTDVHVGLDDPAHENGPVLALVARQDRPGVAPFR
jgi:hypothetical protein